MDEIYKVVTYDTFEKRSIHIDISKILSVGAIYANYSESYFEIHFMLHDSPICVYSKAYSDELINGGKIPNIIITSRIVHCGITDILIHRYPLIFKSINDLEIERFKLLRKWDEYKGRTFDTKVGNVFKTCKDYKMSPETNYNETCYSNNKYTECYNYGK